MTGWNTVVIDAPIFMTAGTAFTLGFMNNSGFGLAGSFSGGAGDYAPGNLYLGAASPFDGWDLNFTTYVDIGATQEEPAPVPEPASMSLVGLGLAGLAWRRARRRQ